MGLTFIADIGSNHNRSLMRTRSLIKIAKEVGCDAIKFQLFDDRLERYNNKKQVLRTRALPREFVDYIYYDCKRVQLPLHFTVFHPDDVFFLDPYVDEFKIGSYELLCLGLIEACAKTRKSIGISTGGGTREEIQAAYFTARRFLPPELITLYHCDPHYPAKLEEIHMEKVLALQALSSVAENKTRCSVVGYSDHTCNSWAIAGAIALGATHIELHLDLDDGDGAESKHGHCWQSGHAQEMIKHARIFYQGLTHSSDCLAMRAARTDPSDYSRPLK